MSKSEKCPSVPLPGTEKKRLESTHGTSTENVLFGPGQAAEAPGFEYGQLRAERHQKASLLKPKLGAKAAKVSNRQIHASNYAVCVGITAQALHGGLLHLATGADVASHCLDLFLRNDATLTRFRAHLPNFPANSRRIGSTMTTRPLCTETTYSCRAGQAQAASTSTNTRRTFKVSGVFL